ncbi:DNA mismatch repair protein MutL [Wolfiporia cocos MD-104 SS10]|uniref:DNA mismatch repair protein PMS1 n=1 Tax=Wolfiporia cocos (strain MD-104) TaxID=742152 RepID=A0A2H3K1D9_WOLCO|nr:DNA mismatch repair protein MutL [Wolfiporia cocos MD-104 SS10]
MATQLDSTAIKALDTTSVHRISSGQVVIDLQTAVKELVENSLDAGASSIEVRLKDYGMDTIEVVDNGSGIDPKDYDAIALKHHTSKLSSFTDLTTVCTFGFRGEALSSLCALSEQVSVTTATAPEAPMGTVVEFDRAGRVTSCSGRVARQRGTTVTAKGLFKPLPVRRKELERNAKREFAKALNLLSAYALVPCTQENKGVRFTVAHQQAGGKKTIHIRTDGTRSLRSSVSALWGPRALEHLVELDLCFRVETEKAVLRRRASVLTDGENDGSTPDTNVDSTSNEVRVRGLVSKFAVSCGRTSPDRQFFFVNGRPCNSAKVQKAFNEVYRTFNANQSPMIVADFTIPTDSCDVNVSPDKRTILFHSEGNLVQALKSALEQAFATSRATFDLNAPAATQTPTALSHSSRRPSRSSQAQTLSSAPEPLFLAEDLDPGLTEIGASSLSGNSKASFLSGQNKEDVSNTTHTDSGADERSISVDTSVGFGRPTLLIDNVRSRNEQDCSDERDSILRNETLETSAGPASRASLITADASSRVSGGLSRGRAAESPVFPTGDSATHQHAVQFNADDHAGPGTGDVSPAMTQVPETISASAGPASMDAGGDGEDSGRREMHANASHDHDRTSRASTSAWGRGVSHGTRTAGEKTTAARDGQMVLSTAGAAWNLRRRAEDEETLPNKKRRTDTAMGSGSTSVREGNSARQVLRAALSQYAQPGSQVVNADIDADMNVADDPRGGSSNWGCADDDISVQGDTSVDLGSNPTTSVGQPGEPEQDMDMDVDEDLHQDSMEVQRYEVIDTRGDDGEQTRSSSVLDAPRGQDMPLISSPSQNLSTQASRPEIVRTTDAEDVSFDFDLARVEACWRSMQRAPPAPISTDIHHRTPNLHSEAFADSGDDREAVEALSRVIDKSDFASMDIVGQFNLGFIIARRKVAQDDSTNGMDDLFIVDQHAADEKYNFERLQQITKIDSQKLIRPQPIELAAADELVALENIDVLRQNGFEIDVDYDVEPWRGHRLKLTAQPTSKSTVFDMKDLEELLHLMQDQPTGHMVRCSKARAMFAMRACRKSVMVGMPLDRRQMTSVVRHMGTMEQPWNCPHGRPTMRHLSDISTAGRDWRRESLGKIVWEDFEAQP